MHTSSRAQIPNHTVKALREEMPLLPPLTTTRQPTPLPQLAPVTTWRWPRSGTAAMRSQMPPPPYLPKDGFQPQLLSHIASFTTAISSEWLSARAVRKAGNLNAGFCLGEAQLRVWKTFQIHRKGVQKLVSTHQREKRFLLYEATDRVLQTAYEVEQNA